MARYYMHGDFSEDGNTVFNNYKDLFVAQHHFFVSYPRSLADHVAEYHTEFQLFYLKRKRDQAYVIRPHIQREGWERPLDAPNLLLQEVPPVAPSSPIW